MKGKRKREGREERKWVVNYFVSAVFSFMELKIFYHFSYGPATQVRWLQDPKPADKAAAAVAKRPAPTTPT